MFSILERVAMAEKVFTNLENVEVIYYNGLTVNICTDLGVEV